MNTLILLSTLAIATVAGDDALKKPKLFFVSTSATTSTLSTYSVCYASTNAAPVACGRKRRTIDFDGMTISGSSVESSATKSLSDEGTEGSSCIGSPPHLFPLPLPSLQHSPYLVWCA